MNTPKNPAAVEADLDIAASWLRSGLLPRDPSAAVVYQVHKMVDERVRELRNDVEQFLASEAGR